MLCLVQSATTTSTIAAAPARRDRQRPTLRRSTRPPTRIRREYRHDRGPASRTGWTPPSSPLTPSACCTAAGCPICFLRIPAAISQAQCHNEGISWPYQRRLLAPHQAREVREITQPMAPLLRHPVFLLAIYFALPAYAQDAPRERAAILPSNSPAMLTGKERLGRKWTDEQRIDNCNVPIDKRGTKPRPSTCHDVPAS